MEGACGQGVCSPSIPRAKPSTEAMALVDCPLLPLLYLGSVNVPFPHAFRSMLISNNSHFFVMSDN